MLLTIDIGNTNVTVGVLQDKKVLCTGRCATDKNKSEEEYALFLLDFLKIHSISAKDFKGSILSSVVPAITTVLSKAVQIAFSITPIIVGPGIKTGLKLGYDNPAQLGADLVVDAVAGIEKYPLPLIIIDLGTATTLSYIDKNKTYKGTVIAPGLEISAHALSSKASQLPGIGLTAPSKVLGTNTVCAMQSGVVLGHASMLDGMIDRIEAEMGEKATVVATGGLSKQVVENCTHKIHFDENLLTEGLYILYQKNK